jgi:hypothetical protein
MATSKKKAPAKKAPAKKAVKKAPAKKAPAKKAAPKKKQFVQAEEFVASVLEEKAEQVLAEIPNSVSINLEAPKSWLKKFIQNLKK